MAQYIRVYMDNEVNNYKNRGLYDIIAFIGEKSYTGKAKLTNGEAYKKGKKIINSRLNKWSLTAIEKLVVADRKKYTFNYDEKSVKPVWKIHKIKASKIFSVIHNILSKYKNAEIIQLFNDICKKYGFSTGADATGSPYFKVIKKDKLLISENYHGEDFAALKGCAKEIKEFSNYH